MGSWGEAERGAGGEEMQGQRIVLEGFKGERGFIRERERAAG